MVAVSTILYVHLAVKLMKSFEMYPIGILL